MLEQSDIGLTNLREAFPTSCRQLVDRLIDICRRIDARVGPVSELV
jgi:hypothetical protein